jgi:arginine deiminase
MPRPRVDGEVGRLRACCLFAPGAELDAMLPRHVEPWLAPVAHRAPWIATAESIRPNPEYLLFDDLVLRGLLAREHADLVAAVRAVTGAGDCCDLRAMLADVLQVADARAAIVGEVLDLEAQLRTDAVPVDSDLPARLADLDAAPLADALIAGTHEGRDLLAIPAPNLLFARDLWAVVGDAVVPGYPRLRARWRDGVIARALLQWHPLLRDTERLDVRASGGLQSDETQAAEHIEGGDVIVAGPDLLLVGIGTRTTPAAALELARRVRQRSGMRTLGVYLPERRATMHLDTIFTFVDRQAVLLHAPAFDRATPPAERVAVVDLAVPEQSLGCDLPAIVADHLGPLERIVCGDGQPRAAEREQWTDGANAFAVAPGCVLLYARNEWTLKALLRAGFAVTDVDAFCADAADTLQRADRVVVALTGAELSRGRGGPRCLTLPIARDP